MKMRALPFAAALVATPLIIAACLTAMLLMTSCNLDQFSWERLRLDLVGFEVGTVGRHYSATDESSTVSGFQSLAVQPDAIAATDAAAAAAAAGTFGDRRTDDASPVSGNELSAASAAASEATTVHAATAGEAVAALPAGEGNLAAAEASPRPTVIQNKSARCFSKESEREIRAAMAAGWSASTAPQFGYVGVGGDDGLSQVPLDTRTCFTITGMAIRREPLQASVCNRF